MSYLKQKIKINSTFSNWTNILNGTPQGSIGSTTFQCLSRNLFLFIPSTPTNTPRGFHVEMTCVFVSTDLVSYVNDNTSFAMASSELEVFNEIEPATESLTLWFQNNFMKANHNFHLLFSDKEVHQVEICNTKLSSTCSETLLGIKIGNKHTFEEHVEELCTKASQKSVR